MTEAEERVASRPRPLSRRPVGVGRSTPGEGPDVDSLLNQVAGARITTIYVDCTPAWDHARLEDLLAPAAGSTKASGNPHYSWSSSMTG